MVENVSFDYIFEFFSISTIFFICWSSLESFSSSAKSYFVLGMNFISFNKNEWEEEETSIFNFEHTELYMYLILSKSEDMP